MVSPAVLLADINAIVFPLDRILFLLLGEYDQIIAIPAVDIIRSPSNIETVIAILTIDDVLAAAGGMTFES